MAERYLSVAGVQIPRFLYGTAWKEEATQRLTELAIQQGFRGIDTANQRRHYHEAAVGQAIAASIAAGLVQRDELFIQTKFTFQPGQDHRLPYEPDAPIEVQVEQSFASSLAHLGVERIDSYVLHGPSVRRGLGPDDWTAWRAMEAVHASGRARLLGISNVSLEQLLLLCREARVRPSFVQNRCFAVLGWDRQVRQFCAENEIVYQGFSLLTANPEALAHPELNRIAKRQAMTPAQAVFCFALQVGMLPLTGTSDPQHMRSDLKAFDFVLTPDETELIEQLVVR